MKRILVIIMSLSIICGIFSIKAISNHTISTTIVDIRPTFVIDAGHGGVDAGAIAIDGTNEKDYNLSIAQTLYDYLIVSGYKAKLIREDDSEVYPNGIDRSKSDLYNRMDYINSFDNSILLSIHQNHFENESEWGTQIWYSANTEMSKILADSISNNIKYYLQPSNKRKNKESDDSYYLLYKATAPSLMIECGFISNREDCKLLKNKEYQKDLSYAILLGLNEEYYG